MSNTRSTTGIDSTRWQFHRIAALWRGSYEKRSPPSLGKRIRRAWTFGELVQASILEMPRRSRKFGQVLEAAAILSIGLDNLHNTKRRRWPSGTQY